MPLDKSFYSQDTISLAKALLGKILVHETKDGKTSGIIVETEAYLGSDDQASHAFRGESLRNKAMFGDPGFAYIYFTYGMYYCFNVTSGEKGVGHGILIRALEPVEGIPLMMKRRKSENIKNLCSGPAKLVIAMGITKEFYGHDLTQSPLYIINNNLDFEIETSKRIGIKNAADLPLRFSIKDNSFVSKKA